MRATDPRRMDDLGAELRFVAERLLSVPALERVRFDEAPDVRAIVAGEPVAFEVQRLREPEQDLEARRRIECARGTGLLATVVDDPAEAQSFAEERIARKCATLSSRPGMALVLVTEGDWRLDTDLLGCAARSVVAELLAARRPCPFGAIVAWSTRWRQALVCVRGDAALLTPALLASLEGMRRPLDWW